MALLSIITPTYNRASYLPRCYESLQSQTVMDFEWILVDDGSTDNTAEVASAFQTDLFPVQILRKKNGGKHTALNAAHPYIHGDYVMILDSDDYLSADAVEEVLRSWKQFEQDRSVGMLVFLKGSDAEKPVCTVQDYMTPVDILRYRRMPISGSDCCEVIRTELFLQFPFPEFPGEKFIGECALWNQVGKLYKCVYINSIVYICKYLDDGLTKSGRSMRIRNPKGGMYTSNLRMDRKNYFIQRIKYGILFSCYGCFAQENIKMQIHESDYPVLTAFCFPLGFLLFLLWKKRYA